MYMYTTVVVEFVAKVRCTPVTTRKNPIRVQEIQLYWLSKRIVVGASAVLGGSGRSECFVMRRAGFVAAVRRGMQTYFPEAFVVCQVGFRVAGRHSYNAEQDAETAKDVCL